MRSLALSLGRWPTAHLLTVRWVRRAVRWVRRAVAALKCISAGPPDSCKFIPPLDALYCISRRPGPGPPGLPGFAIGILYSKLTPKGPGRHLRSLAVTRVRAGSMDRQVLEHLWCSKETFGFFSLNIGTIGTIFLECDYRASRCILGGFKAGGSSVLFGTIGTTVPFRLYVHYIASPGPVRL